MRWWRADWRLSSVAGPCAKLKAAIPAAASIIAASPEEFETDHLLVSANDAWSMKQYGLDASAILLAAWLLMPAERVGSREVCTKMGKLANPKHEDFAKLVAAGMPPPEALTRIGFCHNPSYAKRLLARADIAARVVEHGGKARAPQLGANGPTRHYVISELVGLLQQAREAGNIRHANQVLELIGKAIGMFGGQSVTYISDTKSNAAPMDVARLIASLNALQALPDHTG